MIGHDDEFVEKEFSLIAIMGESFDQEMGRCLASEDWAALGAVTGICNKKMRSESIPRWSCRWASAVCEKRSTNRGEEFQNGTQGLKAASELGVNYGPPRAALPRFFIGVTARGRMNRRDQIGGKSRASARREPMQQCGKEPALQRRVRGPKENGTESRRDITKAVTPVIFQQLRGASSIWV